MSDNKTAHVPTPTPRFQVNAGAYLASRGMLWSHDPEAKGTPPEYPASALKGFAAQVAVYPLPVQKQDGKLSGLGFTLDLARSVASRLSAMDETGYGDYDLTHTAWETGIHYRWPIDIVSIDAAANFGSVTHALPSDFPQSVAIPIGEVDVWLYEGVFRLPDWDESPLFPARPVLEGMQRALKARGIHVQPRRVKNGGTRGAWAALPLEDQGLVMGVLQVSRPAGPDFRQEELDLLQGLAGVAAVGLLASHRVAVERFRLNQLNLVREVSAQIANVLHVDELARRVT